MTKEPFKLSASEAAKQIRDRTLTSEALVASCLERIDDREETVQAWQYVDPDAALFQARERDKQPTKGPLHGVPVGLKDIIDTKDMPTTYGSRAFHANEPTEDADCVGCLLNAGAVILGKTVTTEFAFYAPGKTRNAHNPGHTPGGSSSGSAAAVADFHVPIALGTQTAGSIIRPAAFNGVVGHKPSFGEFPYRGIGVLAASLDTLGGFTRDIDDLTLLRHALATQVPEQAVCSTPPKIAFVATPVWEQADTEMQAAMHAFMGKLSKHGATLTEMSLPEPFDQLVDSQSIVLAVQAARVLRPVIEKSRELIAPRTRALLIEADQYSSDDEIAAEKNIVACRTLMDSVFAEYDLILTPAATGEAPEGLEATGNPVFNRIWTAVHVPCISIPIGRGENGLPLGVQLVGARGEDDQLIAEAEWVWRCSDYEVAPP